MYGVDVWTVESRDYSPKKAIVGADMGLKEPKETL